MAQFEFWISLIVDVIPKPGAFQASEGSPSLLSREWEIPPSA